LIERYGSLERTTTLRKAALSFMMLIVVLSETALATSFSPYPEQCIADPSGRYYVVVKRKNKGDEIDGPVTLTIAEQRNGSPPVKSGSARHPNGESFRATVDPNIRVRVGDIVHGRIDLDRPPAKILVSSTGKGIVTLDVYGLNAIGPHAGENDVVIYSLMGERLHQKHRRALFTERQRRGFPRSDGDVHWLLCCWLDEARDHLIIVSPSERPQLRSITSVSLTSGEVREGGLESIDLAIAERNPHALTPALDLAYELNRSGSQASLPGILEDQRLPLSQRLRAAALLASLGDLRGKKLISTTVLRGAHTEADAADFWQEEVAYAIQHCIELLGEDALPLLKKTLELNGLAFSNPLRKAFTSLGRSGVPTLISVLENDLNVGAQLEAANCLGFIGPEAEEAVPALINALHKTATEQRGMSTYRLDGHAAWALGHIGNKAKAAIPDLEQLANDTDADEYVRDSARRSLAEIK
jgi:hypothetical protein